MPTRIDSLLTPSLGIADLLPMRDTVSLPEIKDLATNSLQSSSLEQLYRSVNARSAEEALLCPELGDGAVVTPEIFDEDLRALVKKLEKSRNPKVRALLRDEILPLMENNMLLSAYRNLMLGG